MNGDGGGKKLLFIGGAVLLGIAIVNNAYRAGLQTGLVGSGRLRGDEFDGWGYIPFPPFPLILIGGLLFLAYRRGVFWPRGGHRGGNGQWPGRFDRAVGPGGGPPPRFLMEWHRRLHEAERQQLAEARRPANGGAAPTPDRGRSAEDAPEPVVGSEVTKV